MSSSVQAQSRAYACTSVNGLPSLSNCFNQRCGRKTFRIVRGVARARDGARQQDWSGGLSGHVRLRFHGAGASDLRTCRASPPRTRVIEHQGSPGGLCDYGIQQRDHALPAIEYRQLHRQGGALKTSTPMPLYSSMRCLWSSSIVPVSYSKTAGDTAQAGLLDQLLIERIHRIRGTRELQILRLDLGQACGGIGQRSATARLRSGDSRACRGLPAPPNTRALVVYERTGEPRLFSEFLLHGFAAAGQIARNRERGLDGREQLRLLLNDLSKSLLDQTIENFVDLLPRNVGTRGKFQRLETRMPDQARGRNEPRTRSAQSVAAGARSAENPSPEVRGSSVSPHNLSQHAKQCQVLPCITGKAAFVMSISEAGLCIGASSSAACNLLKLRYSSEFVSERMYRLPSEMRGRFHW